MLGDRAMVDEQERTEMSLLGSTPGPGEGRPHTVHLTAPWGQGQLGPFTALEPPCNAGPLVLT